MTSCERFEQRTQPIHLERPEKMKRIFVLIAVVAMCVTGTNAQVSRGSVVSPADGFNAALSTTESQMMMLVKAMPAEKYEFAPSQAIFVPSQKTSYDGVRTFGGLILHVAQANYIMAARFGGLKPDVDMKSLAGLKTKDEIDAALAASFAFLHKAIETLTIDNAFQSVAGPTSRVVTVAASLAHTSDEYGQMVEYLRMNGITPPASGAPVPPKK
jgi:hypothetical protein